MKSRSHSNSGNIKEKVCFHERNNYEDDHISEELSRVCELVGIDEKMLDKDPILLSRGQRKLVTIAEALIVDPKVLFLTNPPLG